MKDMPIRLITENKKDFLPLLLLGDDHPMVEDGVLLKDKVYLERKLV